MGGYKWYSNIVLSFEFLYLFVILEVMQHICAIAKIFLLKWLHYREIILNWKQPYCKYILHIYFILQENDFYIDSIFMWNLYIYWDISYDFGRCILFSKYDINQNHKCCIMQWSNILKLISVSHGLLSFVASHYKVDCIFVEDYYLKGE